jgi:prepilin signal peptidase PulO-like enzyme (type II secretory pathway)
MIILTLAVLGLCFGSFVSALTWRLKNPKFSIVTGRSVCPDCHHVLGPIDLVPIFSWAWLRGKCRYCHKTISWQYPAIELVTALVFIFSYIYWPETFHGAGLFDLITWLIIVVGFVALAVYDLRWHILPNVVVYLLTVIAVVKVIVDILIFSKSYTSLLDSLWGILIIAGLFYGLFQVSRGKWIGGGDVKLGVCLGLLSFSPLASLFLLFVASTSGSVASVVLLISKKANHKSQIPFGPFLLIGAMICELFGQSVVNYLKNHVS